MSPLEFALTRLAPLRNLVVTRCRGCIGLRRDGAANRIEDARPHSTELVSPWESVDMIGIAHGPRHAGGGQPSDRRTTSRLPGRPISAASSAGVRRLLGRTRYS
jgi:hypothetical protein